MRVLSVVLALLSLGSVACSAPTNTGDTAPASSQALAAKPYANLAQLMRGIPFPNSNIIFDTQAKDPGAPPPKPDKGGTGAGATTTYASVYSGWEVVEYSALALAETASLIMVPGRVCSNGKPVPNDRDDFKKFAQGLADAGMAAYKAAQSKNLDAMIEISGTVADACAACHEVYRDKGEAGSPERCAVPAP
jgi:hypothetical protein